MNADRVADLDRDILQVHRTHTSGLRIHTDSTILYAIASHFPSSRIASTKCDLIKFAQAGHASASLVDSPLPLIQSRDFEPTLRSNHGALFTRTAFGCFKYIWQGHEFRVYVIDAQNSVMQRSHDSHCYVVDVSADTTPNDENPIDALILAAGVWKEKSDEEVWVFDQGRWEKDRQLWLSVREIEFEDVLGDPARRQAIELDAISFFDARDHYKEFRAPWKRGLIFHGPPGNGKTLTLKAIMHNLMERRSDPVPSLYVKSIASRILGPQGAIRAIFLKARQVAPCLLVFEDIDSTITDEVRSYFFNEVDGLENNDGILIIGSTNHLEMLDAGLSQRPSRFDRKYGFHQPTFDERLQYCHQWSQKLGSKPVTNLTPDASQRIASLTDGFSYAYLQEAYVSASLALARTTVAIAADSANDFAAILQNQIAALKLEMLG